MSTTFRPCHPDQAPLLAPSLWEWLPEGHLADHVSARCREAVGTRAPALCDRFLRYEALTSSVEPTGAESIREVRSRAKLCATTPTACLVSAS